MPLPYRSYAANVPYVDKLLELVKAVRTAT
jgi:hypothetical protein